MLSIGSNCYDIPTLKFQSGSDIFYSLKLIFSPAMDERIFSPASLLYFQSDIFDFQSGSAICKCMHHIQIRLNFLDYDYHHIHLEC